MNKMIIKQTLTTARWQIVVKKSEATKQTKDQNNNKTKINNKKQTNNKTDNNNNKREDGRRWVIKQITNVIIII